MRIGINGRFLVAKRTGVQRAAFNLLNSLINSDSENEYIIFTGRTRAGLEEWNQPNVTIVESHLRKVESFRNHIWEQFTLPRLAKKYKVDILHSPANIAPLIYRGKSIINLHDLCFVVNPQWYSFSFRTLYNFIIPRLARRATRVITNSNNSRNDLLQFFNLPAEKVSLVYWAVDDKFLEQKVVAPTPSDALGLHDDYILYVGSLEPRKNIGSLVEAFEQLRRENPALKTKLILIGGESPLFAEVRLRLRDFKEDVIFKGFVDDSQLRNFYRHAKVVAYPSLYEGFGLPPLEAMASGVPVVTSYTSSIPEVVADAAITVDPRDSNALSQALKEVLCNEKLREVMIKKGYEQVKKFNWLRVARSVLLIYNEVYYADKKSSDWFAKSFQNWKNLLVEKPL